MSSLLTHYILNTHSPTCIYGTLKFMNSHMLFFNLMIKFCNILMCSHIFHYLFYWHIFYSDLVVGNNTCSKAKISKSRLRRQTVANICLIFKIIYTKFLYLNAFIAETSAFIVMSSFYNSSIFYFHCIALYLHTLLSFGIGKLFGIFHTS